MRRNMILLGAMYLLHFRVVLSAFALTVVLLAFVPGVSQQGILLLVYVGASLVVIGSVFEVVSHPAKRELLALLR